ncbi:sulfite exporter TauE/SafE family protein [Acidocella sp.]|uniref:sulfite exporter TauE/SafE family protein n=1 Tax=Acidocella sp. TaxID=50710 RepID=UPI00262BE767|nr:sulfite exporter TauE/SafE family protein [Acidocella sp.]MDD2796067.1 sulfite exporter TauE/SafE family protein [Acidocella sp.]
MMLIENLAIQPGYALSGLLVGLLVGMTGVGGGSLMTPLLVLVFGMHPSVAVGTDLLFASVTKAAGTSIHSAGKTINWTIVARLATGSVPATILTLLALAHFGAANKTVAHLISLTLGTALLLSAISLLLKDWIITHASKRWPGTRQESSAWRTILVGFIVGILVSLSSVGAGALGTIALIYLYPRLPLVRIIGSDIAHAVPLTLLAGLGHWYLGTVNFHLLGSLLLGSIPGIIIGSYAARYTPDAIMKPCLGIILALVGLKLLAR